MSVEQTLSIIKPDGVEKNLIGEIYRRFEKAGLEIVAARMLQLSKEQAEGFYAVHRERPFFNDLVAYMTSGPVVVQALQGDGRRQHEPEPDGCDQSGRCGGGYHPRRLRGQHRRERGARLRCAGNGRAGNRLLFRRRRRLPANALSKSNRGL